MVGRVQADQMESSSSVVASPSRSPACLPPSSCPSEPPGTNEYAWPGVRSPPCGGARDRARRGAGRTTAELHAVLGDGAPRSPLSFALVVARYLLGETLAPVGSRWYQLARVGTQAISGGSVCPMFAPWVGATAGHTRWQRSARPGTRWYPLAGKLTTRALVAQGIEQRFPKPQVAGSIPAGGTQVTALINNLRSFAWFASWHEPDTVVPWHRSPEPRGVHVAASKNCPADRCG